MTNASIIVRRHWFSLLAVILVIGCSIVILALINHQRSPDYPLGWDSPYYIAQARYFEQTGILPQRAGVVSLLVFVHKVTGIPLIQIATILPVFLSAFLAVGTSLLAFSLFRRRLIAFSVIFLIVFWSPATFALTLSTYDNALGLSFSILAVMFFLRGSTFRSGIPFFLASLATAFVHFESYLFYILILGFMIIGLSWYEHSFVGFVRKHKKNLILAFASSIIAIIYWRDDIISIVRGYTTPVGLDGNASIPYASVKTFSAFMAYFKSGLNDANITVLFFSGLFTLIILAFYSRKREGVLPIAYVLSAYLLLTFSILRASIPINRSIPLLPVSFIVAIGLIGFSELIGRRSRIIKLSKLLLIGVGIFFLISTNISYAKRFSRPIGPSVFIGFQKIGNYVADNHIRSFVLVANTAESEKAASAFYGLWYNWAQSFFPLSKSDSTYCLYFGTVANYRLGVATLRPGNSEYSSTSQESVRCLNTLPKNRVSPVYIISALYPEAAALVDAGAKVRDLGEGVFEVGFPASQVDHAGNQ